MILNLACIVEGHGEVEAVPVLLGRMQQSLDPGVYVRISRPIRVPRQKLVKHEELERAIQLCVRQLSRPCAILILVDADDDCPAELGPELLHRAEQVQSNVPVGVVLAKREFEAWFLAAIESLGGRRGLAKDLQAVTDCESIRDAKKALTRNMVESRTYSPAVDQAALAATFDMELARQRSDSFDKCWREFARLLGEVSAKQAEERPPNE